MNLISTRMIRSLVSISKGDEQRCLVARLVVRSF